MSNFLEKCANAAVILGVTVFIGVVVSDRLAPRQPQTGTAKDLIGKSIRIPGMQFPQSRDSLVLAVSTSCHFCKESLPFYKELAAKSEGRLNVVAILPQPLADARNYVQQAALPATQVVSANLGAIGVSATPTLLFLDNKGKVKDVWVGLLDDAKQRQVLSRVLPKS